MGKGGKASENGTLLPAPKYVSMDDVREHNQKGDSWLMIEGKVYDISRWGSKHPGGAKILNHYAGEDATDAWKSFHNDKDFVKKFMKALYVGDVKDKEESELQADFRALRKHVEDSDLLKTKPWFFCLHLGHIILLEILAYCLMSYMGSTLTSFVLGAMILAVAQAQAGWSQHDYGHMSVFPSHKINHIFHHFVIGHLKAASSHWWNFRHFQHHAKPNVLRKDPDVDVAYLFLLGDYVPKSWAQKKKGFMPYQLQHSYWFLIGPPLLLPIYFHIENLMFVFKRRDWMDLGVTITFFFRWFYIFGPIFGGWGVFGLYMFVRFLESHWFTWVTQMSHIPMKIAHDDKMDWFSLQLATTCNVEPGYFNDWFTGHLNYQIEHHLFPTMPRHNLHKIVPHVRAICKKHNIPYRCKSLYGAFADIVHSLKRSGDIWYEARFEG
ncbi:acyl-CoA 6-desaturase-like [Ylistrum balloti]|uniref:acyl-CoA 6-desaturase-like n=1 Tax=Ylistrum balloti TaxID=509963 RepID=UPI0029059576|nr:acyl-CoA 6-desaturase-like [Ylistrum balloti]